MTAHVVRFDPTAHNKHPSWRVALRSGGEVVAWLGPHGWLRPHPLNVSRYSHYRSFRRAWSAAETAVALTYPAVTAISGDPSLSAVLLRPAPE